MGSGLSAVSSLDDPVRARLYQVVSGRGGPVGRDEAAAAAGVGRPLAAYHLDKLVELGLLTAAYQRPEGRTGPGAGRPAKVYTRSGREFAVTVPQREYELAARLLALALESDPGGTARSALLDVARHYGADLGARIRLGAAGESSVRQALVQVLHEHGFEPRAGEDGGLQLRNCPFHQLAGRHPELVCGMTLALIGGLVASVGPSQLHARLDPGPGRCCVAIGVCQPSQDLLPGRAGDLDRADVFGADEASESVESVRTGES
jgi:predicted ArsR family transcriptional regulator